MILLPLLEQALKNSTPLLEVKARRVGGATYQVPVEVDADRGRALAIRWLIKSTRARSGQSMAENLPLNCWMLLKARAHCKKEGRYP